MKKFVWIVSLALLASAPTAFAQSACPSNPHECPTDVGACLAESCPCGSDGAWKNHGQYVKCVVHLRNDLRKAGCLDAAAKRTIASCAARSTCGKEGAVLCCVYDTSATCSDAAPGDGTAAGVCSDDATKPCDTAADCATADRAGGDAVKWSRPR